MACNITRLAGIAVALTAAMPAAAAPGRVVVRAADGHPLADAVVFVDVAGVPPPRPRGPYAVEQRDISFQPHLLIVPVGATVAFPNRDRVRHHVYSFSPAKRFDLKLYGREEERAVVFDKAGVVALGCNIHDQMTGFVVVTSTPFTAQTNAAGIATLPDLPPGRATLRVWYPTIRQSGNMQVQAVAVPSGGLDAQVALRP